MNNITSSHTILLDFLRGFSAQVVLFGHVFSFFWLDYFNAHIYIQDYAILTFFYLSGFLICYGIVKKTRNKQFYLKNFLYARFLRIYTVLVPVLCLVFLFDFIFLVGKESYSFDNNLNTCNLLTNIFLLNGYNNLLSISSDCLNPLGSIRPIWTLSIEWWIYITVGILTFFIFSDSQKNKKTIASVVLFLVLVIVSLIPIVHLISTKLTIVWSLGGISSVILYGGYRKLTVVVNSIIFQKIFIISLFFVSILICQFYGIFSFLGVIIFCLFLFSLFFFTKSTKYNKKFKSVSQFWAFYSYSLYLSHYTVIEFVEGLEFQSDLVSILLALSLSNAVGIFIGLIFEKVLFNKLKLLYTPRLG